MGWGRVGLLFNLLVLMIELVGKDWDGVVCSEKTDNEDGLDEMRLKNEADTKVYV